MLRRVFALAMVGLAAAAPGAEKVLDFRDCKTNEPPAGFRSTLSGSGQPGDWRILLEAAPTALPPLSARAPVDTRRPVLAQLSRDPTDEHFPLLIYEEANLEDFSLTTQFKIVDGKEEQMAGIAFRVQDEKNYYYVRASALGSSFYFLKIVDGIRSAPIGAKVEIPRGVWHDLTIECKGDQIRASLNGKELIPPLRDQSFTAGKFGFWTKSDSVSYFADTRITYTAKEALAHVLVRDTMKKYPRLLGLKLYVQPSGSSAASVAASSDPAELGQPAQPEIQDILTTRRVYHGKDKGRVTVAMPLHDRNGDVVAAVKVVMKAFPGQTEKNALARALPIVKQMEGRIQSGQDLVR